MRKPLFNLKKPLFNLKKPLLVLRGEREYYWGLALLAASCLTLVWALWRDAFKPEVFLAGLLLFSWGYALLWRNDLQQRLTALEEEVGNLRAELAKTGEEAGTCPAEPGMEAPSQTGESQAEISVETLAETDDPPEREEKVEAF